MKGNFNLWIDDISKEKYEEIIKFLKEVDLVPDVLDYDLQGEDLRWWDYEDDMKNLSRVFPDVLFNLWFSDYEDECHIYFLNGKCQHCWAEKVFPPFDPALLE